MHFANGARWCDTKWWIIFGQQYTLGMALRLVVPRLPDRESRPHLHKIMAVLWSFWSRFFWSWKETNLWLLTTFQTPTFVSSTGNINAFTFISQVCILAAEILRIDDSRFLWSRKFLSLCSSTVGLQSWLTSKLWGWALMPSFSRGFSPYLRIRNMHFFVNSCSSQQRGVIWKRHARWSCVWAGLLCSFVSECKLRIFNQAYLDSKFSGLWLCVSDEIPDYIFTTFRCKVWWRQM